MVIDPMLPLAVVPEAMEKLADEANETISQTDAACYDSDDAKVPPAPGFAAAASLHTPHA